MESSLASVLLAGTDTVSAFLEWFVLYMTVFPDVQEKCFEEIERVIGMASINDVLKCFDLLVFPPQMFISFLPTHTR